MRCGSNKATGQRAGGQGVILCVWGGGGSNVNEGRSLIGLPPAAGVAVPQLRHMLLNMAAVGRSLERYMVLRSSGAFYITDGVRPVSGV